MKDIGEEIYASYGAHGNDVLLVDCRSCLLLHENSARLTLPQDGFILETNKWDSLPLDDFFCSKRLSRDTKARLKNAGYLG